LTFKEKLTKKAKLERIFLKIMSSDDKFDWGNGLPKLDIHGQAKHEILREYVISYLKVVCQQQRMPEFKIALVDGFAGESLFSRA